MWGCGDPSMPAHMAIGATTDGATAAAWSNVLELPQIASPAACAAGTLQATCARPETWCTVATQLNAPDPACAAPVDGVTPPDGAGTDPGGGCCSAGGGDVVSAFVLAALTLALVQVRRRA